MLFGGSPTFTNDAAFTLQADYADTGANDVVGVAAALATLSLIVAGAVSLKK